MSTAPPRPESGAPASTAGTVSIDGQVDTGRGGAAPAAAEVPEHPTLAPGVRLVGEMSESAFVEPPWMIDRDGIGYLQVTPLLHRIAELCDGRHDVGAIASEITSNGEPVKPETVGRLIAQMLIPSGVVVNASGEVQQPPARPRSPLQISARMRMLGPGAIEPITGVLRAVFWPPILLVILAATIASRIWLYAIHGVGQPAHDTLYHPATLGVILALVVATAMFHEFGHASALRYGGGRVRGMGVGFYMVYPAVYTDVTENYRLPRWARLRTDLGGFTFNLIFALGVLGAYALTGAEFLLVALLLTDLEILQQTLPFVRLDGYWALADITGIPDLFTAMRAFWAKLLRRPQRVNLPELTRWGKVVVAGYSLLTVPVLGLLLLLMVEAVPRVLATAWDSASQQAGWVASAANSGDWLSAAGHLAQILLLCVPAVALIVMLVRVVVRGQRRLWTWAAPARHRQAVAALLTASGACLVGFLWAPALPGGGQGPLAGNVRPISETDRGTLGDLTVSPGTPAPGGAQPAPQTSTGTAPTPASTPDAGATAAAQPTAAPSATPSPASTAQATASPSPSP
jgi:putative peptide zinc metalloprotease protein